MKKRELLERIEALEKENTRLWERVEALGARPWQSVLPRPFNPWVPDYPVPPPSWIVRYSDNTTDYTQNTTTDGQPISTL